MEVIDRVRGASIESLDYLRTALRGLNEASPEEALAALAAFLRVRLAVTASSSRPDDLAGASLEIESLITIVERFLAEDVDRPKRTQGLVAAAFDMVYDRILTRRINDPSRDFPGDIQAFADDRPVMSAEVRGKAVPATEVLSFARALQEKGISRAFVVVIHPTHQPLDRIPLLTAAWRESQVVVTIIESAAELVWAVAAWSIHPLESMLDSFPAQVAHRLNEIEASSYSKESWTELVSGAGL
jgi:hypothetical protein